MCSGIACRRWARPLRQVQPAPAATPFIPGTESAFRHAELLELEAVAFEDSAETRESLLLSLFASFPTLSGAHPLAFDLVP